MRRSSLSRRTALKSSGRIKTKKRSKSEFARIYGSKERVEFVKSLPCAACGTEGYSENAHVLGNGGLSRKGDYRGIAPLCGPHPHRFYRGWMHLEGCHAIHDRSRSLFKHDFPDFDPEKAAADCQTAWLSQSGGQPKGVTEK